MSFSELKPRESPSSQSLWSLSASTSADMVVLTLDVAAGPRLDNHQLYKFSYRTEVLLDRAGGSKTSSAGYRITSDVSAHLVWRDPGNKDDQLIQLAVCQHESEGEGTT